MPTTNPSIRRLFTNFVFAARMSDTVSVVYDVGYFPDEDSTSEEAARGLHDLANDTEEMHRHFTDPDADDMDVMRAFARLPRGYHVYWGREGCVVRAPDGDLSHLTTGNRQWEDTLTWAYADLLDVSHEPPASSDPVVWDLDARVKVGAPTEEILAAERAGRVGARFEYRGRHLFIERDEHVHDFDG